MLTLHRILLGLAILFFILAAVGVPTRVNLVALGLALVTLTLFLA